MLFNKIVILTVLWNHLQVCHGLHNLIVPIRDPVSLQTYPGLVIGDMGEKLGLNGVDNGFMMFDRYRVSREALLDATGGIDQVTIFLPTFLSCARLFYRA